MLLAWPSENNRQLQWQSILTLQSWARAAHTQAQEPCRRTHTRAKQPKECMQTPVLARAQEQAPFAPAHILTDPTALAHTPAPNAALDAHTHRRARPDKVVPDAR